ncbi:MAG: sigma-70 family RNA polymerase sigma factor [Planctomycetes bacterium]|nr:sigma-70 family RNA polymerase sigma factor [Planctomycetota bacterium]
MPDRRGNPEAESLLAEHLPALLAYVRLHADPLIRQHESCTDIVQSVCREVIENMDSFDYRGVVAFRSWLFIQVKSKLADRRRHHLAQKRDVRRQQPLPAQGSHSGLEALYASLCSPSLEAVAQETIERFERAFDLLPEQYREVITLARIVGLGHAEIAARLGREQGAVRTLLHRALARLGRLMDTSGAAASRDPGRPEQNR